MISGEVEADFVLGIYRVITKIFYYWLTHRCSGPDPKPVIASVAHLYLRQETKKTHDFRNCRRGRRCSKKWEAVWVLILKAVATYTSSVLSSFTQNRPSACPLSLLTPPDSTLKISKNIFAVGTLDVHHSGE